MKGTTRDTALHDVDISTRNRIIDAHMDLVYKIARSMCKGFCSHADYEELVSFGTMGLIDAAGHYDPVRGFRFEAYAAIRIRGAIIDAMRKRDWVPRNVRKRYEQIEQYSIEWRAVHGKPPTDEQIARGLGISTGRVARAKCRWMQRRFVSIEWESECGACSVVEQDDHVIPENALLNKENISALKAALGMLPERQRRIVALSYFEEMTLKGIGYEMGVSESRVSQLRSKALQQLRQAMMD